MCRLESPLIMLLRRAVRKVYPPAATESGKKRWRNTHAALLHAGTVRALLPATVENFKVVSVSGFFPMHAGGCGPLAPCTPRKNLPTIERACVITYNNLRN